MKHASKATILIVIAALLFTVLLFAFGAQDPSVSIEGGTLKISAMFGVDIAMTDVQSVRLLPQPVSELFPQRVRENGFGGFGDAQKGYFSAPDIGDFMLFVHADASPTILIERYSGSPIYLNFKDPGTTQAVYGEITTAIGA